MIYYNGNLFDSKADVLCHQVNLYGVMGGGIAAEVRERFPGVNKAYEYVCSKYNLAKAELLGMVLYCKTDDTEKQFIANCFSQNIDSIDGCLTNYEAARKCFNDVKVWMKDNNKKTVAFPYKYGCGIAGGDWDIVEGIIDDVFYDVDVEIWKL